MSSSSTTKGTPSAREGYRALGKHRISVLVVLLALVLVGMFADILVGTSALNPVRTLAVLAGVDAGDTSRAIIWGLRVPMTLTCVVVGASLALAGEHMQTILNNPLASPYTLGISSAASFGSCFSVITGFPYTPVGSLNAPLSAICFAMIAAAAIVVASRKRGADTKTMILFGIVIDFFFSALQVLTQYMATRDQLSEIMHWMFGSLSKASWEGVVVCGVVFCIVTAIASKFTWKLTALSLGDDRARSLGINTDALRISAFALTAILTAVAVSYVGAIGFIGLISPHLARTYVGEDQRFLAPVSCLFGILLLLAASLIAKVIVPGLIIPVGIITNIVGVVFLATLIFRGRV